MSLQAANVAKPTSAHLHAEILPQPHCFKENVIAPVSQNAGHSTQVKCTECGHESNTYDVFLDLSLEINKASSVQKALQRFTTSEYLDGANKYICPKQKQKVRAAKCMSIDQAPAVLVLQLKRFEFSMFGHKINKKVCSDHIRGHRNCCMSCLQACSIIGISHREHSGILLANSTCDSTRCEDVLQIAKREHGRRKGLHSIKTIIQCSTSASQVCLHLWHPRCCYCALLRTCSWLHLHGCHSLTCSSQCRRAGFWHIPERIPCNAYAQCGATCWLSS